MKGLYNKYNIQKNGKDTDPDADYFALRLDTDENARQAMLLYAHLIRLGNPILAKDIRKKVASYDDDCVLHLPVAYNTKGEEFITLSEIQYDSYGNLSKVVGIDEDGDTYECRKDNIDLNDGDYY
jgi:hypothetical protein